MRRRLREVSVEHEVPFHHVDALRVVWHGHYFAYFELARTALLRSCGLDPRAGQAGEPGAADPAAADLIGRRYRLVVIDSRCRHTGPLRYGDRVRTHAWFRDHHRRIMIAYEVVNLSLGRRAARGHTALATLDAEGRLLLETPPAIVERIRG